MSRSLAITVRLHDARYHGIPDWPPAPARLFQALVAGAARGSKIAPEDQAALKWLESLPPPIIAVPAARQGRGLVNFVPNNDLDSVDRDPARSSAIRTSKSVRPHLLDASAPLHYHWPVPENDADGEFAGTVCQITDKLYQLGRGVDMAWAHGEIIDTTEAESRLARFPGVVHRPGDSIRGDALACPETGSLESLIARHAAQRTRLMHVVIGRKRQQVFSQPPKPRFRQVSYDSPSAFRLYDLISYWPSSKCGELANRIRDAAADKLAQALPDRRGEIERVLIGRTATEADKPTRVRILPLPSIGHQHADRVIRRVLVEVPPNCPIGAGDIEWAFSGLTLDVDKETGEVCQGLISAADSQMLRHYGIGAGRRARRWRTVTAAALPWAARRKIDPRRTGEALSSGAARAARTNDVAGSVVHALRHAGVRGRVLNVRVQREPFEARDASAGAFAEGTRFVNDKLWHVDIEFVDPVSGPLIVGDGRYMGLGLMAPARIADKDHAVHSFQILDGLATEPSFIECARALRRAVMARVQDQIGVRNPLSTFFTGHEPGGAPARSGIHSHLAFAADIARKRLFIVPPHILEHRSPNGAEQRHLRTLEQAVSGFTSLRARTSGRLSLIRGPITVNGDPLFDAARQWESVTEYRVTRHVKRVPAQEALELDVRCEIRRLALPEPTSVEVLEVREGPKGGLSGRLRLRFESAVCGPILIGRTRHLGGGLFSAVD